MWTEARTRGLFISVHHEDRRHDGHVAPVLVVDALALYRVFVGLRGAAGAPQSTSLERPRLFKRCKRCCEYWSGGEHLLQVCYIAAKGSTIFQLLTKEDKFWFPQNPLSVLFPPSTLPWWTIPPAPPPVSTPSPSPLPPPTPPPPTTKKVDIRLPFATRRNIADPPTWTATRPAIRLGASARTVSAGVRRRTPAIPVSCWWTSGRAWGSCCSPASCS